MTKKAKKIGLIIGTGPSLRGQVDQVRRFPGLLFGCNNTFEDFALDVWLACDEKWHEINGRVSGPFDKWHWSEGVCRRYGYRHIPGVWMDGLWLEDASRIAYNHCSTAQLLNLAANPYLYGCEAILLVGHDFHYDAGQRHYFDNLSDAPGEYPAPLRKFSAFDKGGGDLLETYQAIADQAGRPPIYNATPGSNLRCFPATDLETWL